MSHVALPNLSLDAIICGSVVASNRGPDTLIVIGHSTCVMHPSLSFSLYLARACVDASSLLALIPTVYLLLQYNTIHAGLQQRAHQTRLPLQYPQSIENLGGGAIGQGVELGGEL